MRTFEEEVRALVRSELRKLLGAADQLDDVKLRCVDLENVNALLRREAHERAERAALTDAVAQKDLAKRAALAKFIAKNPPPEAKGRGPSPKLPRKLANPVHPRVVKKPVRYRRGGKSARKVRR